MPVATTSGAPNRYRMQHLSLLGGRTRRIRAEEHLPAVGERQVRSVGAVRAVTCLVALDRDDRAGRKGFPVEPAPTHRVGGRASNRQSHRFPVGPLTLTVTPRMG